MVMCASLALPLNVILISKVRLCQVMFDNGLVCLALEPLGWLGFRWLMKLTGVVLSGRNHKGKGKNAHTEDTKPYIQGPSVCKHRADPG